MSKIQRAEWLHPRCYWFTDVLMLQLVKVGLISITLCGLQCRLIHNDIRTNLSVISICILVEEREEYLPSNCIGSNRKWKHSHISISTWNLYLSTVLSTTNLTHRSSISYWSPWFQIISIPPDNGLSVCICSCQQLLPVHVHVWLNCPPDLKAEKDTHIHHECIIMGQCHTLQ